jgi:formylglycine-generating enzyme required for sulfatase activity
LRTDSLLVGVVTLPAETASSASSLHGDDCARATHLVRRIHLGGFVMVAGPPQLLGSGASTFGGQGRVGQVQLLAQEGEPEWCAHAGQRGEETPRCAVPLRIHLSRLACSEGTRWDGTECAAVARMVRIPGGAFTMGSQHPMDANPAHATSLRSFQLDVTEVTVSQYRACVRAKICTPAGTSGACNSNQPGREEHPINCVDRYQAMAYCRWVDKRLPSEAEWEYAARGADGRTYPWGNSRPNDRLCWRGEQSKVQHWSTCPVGRYPAGDSPFGVHDMAGNVWEWTATDDCGDASELDSPHEEADGSIFMGCVLSDRAVVRGGSWDTSDLRFIRATYQDNFHHRTRAGNLGFRCAR